MAHNADNQVARFEIGIRRRRLHGTKRFMTDHKSALTGRRPAIMAADDVPVGAAYADCDRSHQHRSLGDGRLGNVFDPRGFGSARRYG